MDTSSSFQHSCLHMHLTLCGQEDCYEKGVKEEKSIPKLETVDMDVFEIVLAAETDLNLKYLLKDVYMSEMEKKKSTG
eukprot:scaffold73723_cov67-Attheya_sp.AAC.2